MKINWKKQIHIGKNIFFFFLGVVFIHILTNVLMSTLLPEMIRSISREELENFFVNIDKEIFSSLVKIYMISFALFYFLPQKFSKSRWYLRGIYFIIFYFFCILIYLWI